MVCFVILVILVIGVMLLVPVYVRKISGKERERESRERVLAIHKD